MEVSRPSSTATPRYLAFLRQQDTVFIFYYEWKNGLRWVSLINEGNGDYQSVFDFSRQRESYSASLFNLPSNNSIPPVRGSSRRACQNLVDVLNHVPNHLGSSSYYLCIPPGDYFL